MNGTVHQGDWLEWARRLAPASVDMLYVDPPFNTGTTQRTPPGARRFAGTRAAARGHARDARAAYEDSWSSPQAYIAWLRERLAATTHALKPCANVLIHCDWRACHHVRLMLDELLGADRFVNHLIWHYGLGGSSPRRFARKHDDIVYYCVDPERYYFDPPMVPATSRRMNGRLKKATDVIRESTIGGSAEGSACDALLDIPSLNNMASERTGYPTQKPLELLELLVRACSPPGGMVLDPCCGSGTTLVAALRTGRHAMGCDINSEAVRLATRRMRDMHGTPRGRTRV